MYWKGRIRKMKKILKRVIATVAAFAFAAAGLVVAPKTAKAAETTVKVYVEFIFKSSLVNISILNKYNISITILIE